MKCFIGRSQPAVLNLIAVDRNDQSISRPCFVKLIDGDRLIVACQRPPRLGSKVSVSYRDALFLGQTVRSFPTASGWRSEICVERIMTASESLLNLANSLHDENAVRLPAGYASPANVSSEATELKEDVLNDWVLKTFSK